MHCSSSLSKLSFIIFFKRDFTNICFHLEIIIFWMVGYPLMTAEMRTTIAITCQIQKNFRQNSKKKP